MESQIVVVGGGAAGMMAALSAAQSGACVILLERNQKVGRKLYITGKGRCNLTNDCPADEALSNVPHNSRFLTSAMTRFPPSAVQEFFTGLGVPLKTERGGRVFPQSDRAADVIDALFMALRRQKVSIVEDRAVRLLATEDRISGVKGERGTYPCAAAVLATGGCSYPLTGSTGDGYKLAQQAGHTLIEPVPSLVSLVSHDADCKKMMGLALKNVTLTLFEDSKAIFDEQGEMLFTHFGISGPLTLSASSHLGDMKKHKYHAEIDLKPALDEEKLDARLLRELGDNANKDMQNVMGSLVPRLMVPVALRLADIPLDRKAHDVTRGERRRLLETLKGLTIHIKGPRPIAEAIVTSGGIKVGEIDPRTMQSKKLPGLFFAGELIDVDAYTGGFNLQIAWATGRAAGAGAAAFLAGL